MIREFSSIVNAPRDDVFAWHARPGAIHRLTPPWQPVAVVEETGSLRDGRAVLRFPGGLRWVAAHQPDGYAPPERFVDQLVSWPLAAVLAWRHTHEFAVEDGRTTRLTDRLETRVPDAMLRSMFRYRHRQLSDELAVHARARQWSTGPLTVAITGADGALGVALSALLSTGGHRVIRLVSHPPQAADERRWYPVPDRDLLSGVDAVVHLSGTSGQRERVVAATRHLAELVAHATDGPTCLVNASSTSVYGLDRGDEVLTESSSREERSTHAAREDALAVAVEAGIRISHVRAGVVQTPRAGLLWSLAPLTAFGGRMRGGDNWMPWIGIDDLCDVYLRALLDERLAGPINATAPEPVRTADYLRTLAGVFRGRPAIPIPPPVVHRLLGRAQAAEFAGIRQQVRPHRLLDLDHRFRHARLDQALRHLCGQPVEGAAGRSE